MLSTLLSAIVFFVIGAFVSYLLGRSRMTNPPKGLRAYMTTHHFASQSERDKLDAYESQIGKAKMTKILTGRDALCMSTIRSKEHLMTYCYWYAKSPEAVRRQLEPISAYYQDTEIEETTPMVFWQLI